MDAQSKPLCMPLVWMNERWRIGAIEQEPIVTRCIRKSLNKGDWTATGSVSNYARGQLAGELSDVLGRRDFYEEASWRGVELPREAQDLLARGPGALG